MKSIIYKSRFSKQLKYQNNIYNKKDLIIVSVYLITVLYAQELWYILYGKLPYELSKDFLDIQ